MLVSCLINSAPYFGNLKCYGTSELTGKNYKIQITKYKQIPNYNVQNYKQPYRAR